MKKFFTENINYKLAAVFLAIALKLYFISPRNQIQDSIIVPISIVDMPKTLAIISPRNLNNLTTTVTVSGPRSLVEQYKSNPRDIKVPLMYLSQKQVAEGGFAENINLKQHVNVPNGLELEDIAPAILKLTLDKNYKKNVGIEVRNNLVGELERGYELKNVTVTPSSVMLTGPALEIGKIGKINTEKIDITPFTEPQEFHVMLDTIGELVTYNVDMVKVNLDIVLKTKVKQFSRVPVRAITDDSADGGGTAGGKNEKNEIVSITPATVRVELKIREDEVDNIKQENIQIVVDTRALQPGEHLVKPQLKEADGRFTLVETVPAVVNVKMK